MKDRCPECGLGWRMFPPAHVDEQKPDGRFAAGSKVRCVECKGVFTLPLAEMVTSGATWHSLAIKAAT